MKFGDFELDETRFELRRAGEPVAVQRRVMDLLVYLVKNRERVATREEIFAAVWPGVVVSSAALGQAVMEARRALGEHGEEWIQTVRGRGFRFVAPVVERAPTVAPTSARPERESGLVGRSAVWQVISEALAAVAGGRGSVLLVGGDEGSGKTRLLEEARASATAQGMATLAADLDESRRDPSHTLVLRDIEETARAAPLLVTLDDVHRASAEDLALVASLARLARRTRIVVLASSGERELERESPDTLRDVARAGTVLRLERLTVSEVGELVRAHTGRTVDAQEAAALHTATGGNPRLVLQLASSGVETSRALRPGATVGSSADALRSFRRAALARADALSPASRRVISAAAVLGRDVVVGRVAALLGEEPSHVFGVIDELLAANLLRRKSEAVGSYRFAIGLVRDGLYEALPEEARARLHHAAARLPGADTAEALLERAKHAVRAGLFMEADERADLVAKASTALAGESRHVEAVALVRRALAAQSAHDDAGPSEARRKLEAALDSAVAAGTPGA